MKRGSRSLPFLNGYLEANNQNDPAINSGDTAYRIIVQSAWLTAMFITVQTAILSLFLSLTTIFMIKMIRYLIQETFLIKES